MSKPIGQQGLGPVADGMLATADLAEHEPQIVDPDPAQAEDYEVGLKSLNQWQLAWRKFRKHKLALIGLAVLAVLLVGGGHRPHPDAVQLHRHPAAGRDRPGGASAQPRAPDGRDRRPAA